MDPKKLLRSKPLLIGGGLLLALVAYMVYGNIKYADQPTEYTPPTNGAAPSGDSGGREMAPVGYSGGQSNFKINPDGTVTWSVQIHKADSKTLKPVAESSEGAEVTVEFRSSRAKTTFTGTVQENGWVSWTTPTPELETKIYLMDIKGDVFWIPADRDFWSTRPILAWLDSTGSQK
jgi:hypothetical protein